MMWQLKIYVVHYIIMYNYIQKIADLKFNNYVATENQGFSVSFKLPAGTSKIQKFKESASVKVCRIFIL